jgi:hypothetical protein
MRRSDERRKAAVEEELIDVSFATNPRDGVTAHYSPSASIEIKLLPSPGGGLNHELIPDVAETSDSEEEEEVCTEVSIATGSSSTKKNKVRFSTVQIRRYGLTIGDHPHTELYPISLDWSHAETETVLLSHYESMKPPVPTRKGGLRGIVRMGAVQRLTRLATVMGQARITAEVEEIKKRNLLKQAVATRKQQDPPARSIGGTRQIFGLLPVMNGKNNPRRHKYEMASC